MNAFVRDGAVNRRRRFRHSATTRNAEPERKKVCRSNNDGATTASRDLAARTPRLHSGESTVDQSTVVTTKKDSRYLNADFMRTKNFLYLNYKKISYINVNKSLKEHLKQFDENETQLKRIFEQCYDITGSVEKSKAMMKQLETNTCVRLDLTPNLSSGVSYRLHTLPRKVVEKTVKKVHIMKDNKSMKIHSKLKIDMKNFKQKNDMNNLKQRIDMKNLKLFGKLHSNNDKKILYANFDVINPGGKVHLKKDKKVINMSFNDTNTVDDGSFCRITKNYSMNSAQYDSFGVTIITNPKTGLIVRGHPILRVDKHQSNTYCAEESIPATNHLKGVFTSVHKKSKEDPSVHDTVNSQISSSNMNNVEEMINTDASFQNAEGFLLETVNDVGEIVVPQLKIDDIVSSTKGSALKTIIDVGEITVPQLKMDLSVNSSKGSAQETIIDVGEIMVPQLKKDGVKNCKGSALETFVNIGEITVPQLKMDESVKNAKCSSLQSNIDVKEITVSRLQMSGSVKSVKGSVMETNIDDEEIIGLENQTSVQDLISSQVEKIVTDIDNSEKQSKILDHTNIKLKIRKIINIDDDIFKSSIIQDLATYFLNNDFLSKIDTLWKTTESELVGELITKLLTMFNDRQYNMAQFSSCLICIFREIAKKSSIPPCEMKLKLIVFLDAIKKYIKFHDDGLWRNWFLPSMFFDWCFVVAAIFMNTENDFKINLNKLSIVKNATTYYKKVKRCKYLFIDQDFKPNKSHKKSGIFELTRIDDLLEIDKMHTINNTEVIPNIPIDIPSNEPKLQKLVTNNDCMDSINHTTLENIEEVCPAPAYPQIFVRPEFSFSNSFINKSKWFTVDVNKLENDLNISMSNKSIGNSTVARNNTTVVGNKTEPSFVNKLQSIKNKHVRNKRSLTNNQNVTNKPSKRKKSDTQVASPRVFYTIANNPKEFDITYGSSAVPQNISSSATVPQHLSPSTVPQHLSPSTVPQHLSPSTVPQLLSSSTVPQHLSPSTVPQHLSPSTVSQHLSPSTVSQHLSPYYHNISSNNAQLPVTLQAEAPQNLNLYYNNITSDYTQVRSSLQTRPSISNARSMNSPVDINSPSSKTTQPPVSSNTWQSIYHQNSVATNLQSLKAATKWPSNIYTSVCNDPFCSESSTYSTQHTNSAQSYLQSSYNYNIPSAISHPQHSNALTYPTNYIQPLLSKPLASIAAKVASMNTYMLQRQNANNDMHNYSNCHSSRKTFQTPDHNTQVSPDLPDARLPNMPNHQDSDIINKTCTAANCTNTARYRCNDVCMAAFYCSTQCQKSDWHYHQNECQ